MQYQLFLFFAFLLSVVDLLSIFYLISNYENKRVRWFFGILVLNLGWLIFNSLELLAGSQEWTLNFMKISFVFLMLLPPTWLFFVMSYLTIEIPSWMKWLYLIPGVNILLLLTNAQHHLFWQEYLFSLQGEFLTIQKIAGPIFIEHAMYSYLLLLVGLIIILVNYMNAAVVHRKRAAVVFISISLSFLYSIFHILGYLPWQKDFSPIVFGFSLLIVTNFSVVRGFFELTIVPRQRLFEYISDGIVIFDDTGTILDINPGGLAILGNNIGSSDVLGKKTEEVFSFWKELKYFNPSEQAAGESLDQSQIIVITVEDQLMYYDVSVHQMKSAYVVILHDVSEIQKLMIRVEELANFDALTKLRNRRSFFNAANILLKYSKRNQQSVSIILMDIDNFKVINDRYGHLLGDLVLKDVAEILEKTLRAVDIKARYGGDEFIILLPQTTLEDAKIVAEKLLEQVLAHQFTTGSQNLSVTFSLGVSGRNLVDRDFTIMKVIEEADAALYHAKKTGKNRFVVHSFFVEQEEQEISG